MNSKRNEALRHLAKAYAGLLAEEIRRGITPEEQKLLDRLK